MNFAGVSQHPVRASAKKLSSSRDRAYIFIPQMVKFDDKDRIHRYSQLHT
jgi:hypothetical protein